jgi:hypothetical protein
MKILFYLLVPLALISCCEYPAPEKRASLEFTLTSKKDSVFFKNIKRIYAVGANTSNQIYNQSINRITGLASFFQLNLPVSYAADSTIYVFENQISPNDTVIVQYKRDLFYKRTKNCGYQQVLSPPVKNHYSTLKKYKLIVSFGGFSRGTGILKTAPSEFACKIQLTER